MLRKLHVRLPALLLPVRQENLLHLRRRRLKEAVILWKSFPWEEVSLKEKMLYLQKLNDKVPLRFDNRVRKVQASLSDSTSHVLFCNSEGVTYYDYPNPMVSFMAVCIMEENGKMENGYAGRSYRKGFEFMTDDIVDIVVVRLWIRLLSCSRL